MNRIPRWTTLIVAGLTLAAVACGSGNDPADGQLVERTAVFPGESGQAAAVRTPVPATVTPTAGAAAPTSATASPATASAAATATATARAAAVPSPTATQAAGGRATAIDPCRLVTVEEARVALGAARPPAAERTTSVGGDPQCVYGELATTGHVVVVLASTDPGSSARADLDGRRRALGGEEVRGVGDAAFLVPSLRLIEAVAGNTRFQISLSISTNPNMPPADVRAKLTDLGKAAAGRLR